MVALFAIALGFPCCPVASSDRNVERLDDLQPVVHSTPQLLRPSNAAQQGPRLLLWKEHPRVLVLEFRSKKTQACAMNRIAAFVEKKGTRGRVLDDGELERFITESGSTPETFYWAHDYRANDLDRFFTAAKSRGRRLDRQILNPCELSLSQLLVRRRLLTESGQARAADVLLTIPADLDPRTRVRLLTHELRHALYFSSEAYRATCDSFWRDELDEVDRTLFRLTLALYHYDPEDGYLVRNEFQSFLLQEGRTFDEYVKGASSRDRSGQLARYLTERPGRIVELAERLRKRLGPLHLKAEVQGAGP